MSRPAPDDSPRIQITKSRPASTRLRSGPSLLGGAAALVTLVNSMLPGAAHAQQAKFSPTPSAPLTTGSTSSTTLPEVEVLGQEGYQTDSLSSSKFTGSVLTIPQAVQVITPQLREDQNDDSLRDSLRNVSGLALGAGEGSYQGDNFTIRGFNAATDIFLDGMQDFGNYYRDPFNIENVEVLKGPSAAEFGRGSTAGAINMVTKTPELESFVAGSAVYGTDETHRGTLDVNEPIPWLEGSAFRLNVMGHEQDVTDRNDVDYNRWGIAPSLAFGLDTPTRIILSYFYQYEDDNPDYGIPWVNDRPAPVGRDAFYGFTDDYFKARVNEGTITFEHDFNDDLTLHEQLRLSDAYRKLRVTQGQLADEDTPPGESLDDIEAERVEIDGVSNERDVDNDINLQWKASEGPFDNKVVLGFEYIHQSADPRRAEPSWTGVPSTSLLHPDQGDAFTGFGYTSIIVNGHADTYSEYLTDTLKVGKQWTAIGGLRYDSIASLYNESLPPVTSFTANNARLNWRAALVYQPAPNGSIYAAVGESFHPNVQQQSLINEPTLPESFKDLPVGENIDYEVGTKWDLFSERLSVGADLFWDDQKNPAAEDADDDLLYVTNGKERDIGIELDAAGHITDPWQVYASFTCQRGVVTSANPSNLVGEPILNTPRCTFSVWTTYDLPWKFEAGLGVDGVGARAGSETPDPVNGLIMEAPGYVLVSAMLKYQINSHVDIQANVTNLLDQAYYESVHPGHVVPGEGRTFYISTNFKF
ncbi:MAG: TonB-dependent siderophore receptor [Chthoniobacteraceae bacterium]